MLNKFKIIEMIARRTVPGKRHKFYKRGWGRVWSCTVHGLNRKQCIIYYHNDKIVWFVFCLFVVNKLQGKKNSRNMAIYQINFVILSNSFNLCWNCVLGFPRWKILSFSPPPPPPLMVTQRLDGGGGLVSLLMLWSSFWVSTLIFFNWTLFPKICCLKFLYFPWTPFVSFKF